MSFVGQTIGNYKVVQQIGEGGMGVVYLAEHPVIGRKVAIKLLHATFAKDSETVARFFNEARAIHMIAHPNIVEILDFGQTTDGQPYFIMEFLSGEPLAERVSRGPIQVNDAVAIASQICDALQAAHDKRIIHRDLKPHNVYLIGQPPSQAVKILDFGVAKMATGWDTAQSGGQSVKTRTGSLMGTPLYMSPEQCRGSGKLDHRTDIYSLAVIVFEMISGRPPFVAEGVGELFAKHMLEPAPSLAEFAPRTPPHVVKSVARALAKELDDRFPTMRAFRDALNGQREITGPDLPKTRSPVAQPVTISRSQQALPPEQTTLSSAVSELEGEIDRVPTRSRKGLAIGGVAAVGLAAVAFLVLRGNKGPDDAAAVPPAVAAKPAPTPEPAAPPETKPKAPETVTVKLDADPAATHVLRRIEGQAQPQDLGGVPLELKLPRGEAKSEYLMRAEGFKDRTVSVDLSHDQVLHVALERQPTAAADKDKNRPKPAPPKPVKPKRPTIHDADGLAVPSF